MRDKSNVKIAPHKYAAELTATEWQVICASRSGNKPLHAADEITEDELQMVKMLRDIGGSLTMQEVAAVLFIVKTWRDQVHGRLLLDIRYSEPVSIEVDVHTTIAMRLDRPVAESALELVRSPGGNGHENGSAFGS